MFSNIGGLGWHGKATYLGTHGFLGTKRVQNKSLFNEIKIISSSKS